MLHALGGWIIRKLAGKRYWDQNNTEGYGEGIQLPEKEGEITGRSRIYNSIQGFSLKSLEVIHRGMIRLDSVNKT